MLVEVESVLDAAKVTDMIRASPNVQALDQFDICF